MMLQRRKPYWKIGMAPLVVIFGLGSYRANTKEIQPIEDPKLLSKGKAPVRHQIEEQDTHHFPETPKDHYKRIYFNAIL